MHHAIKRLTFPLLFAILFAIAHFGIWAFTNHTIQLLDAPPLVGGFAYSGYQKTESSGTQISKYRGTGITDCP